MVETWLHPHYPRSRWSFWRYSFYSEKLSQDCLYRMSAKAKSRFYTGILVYCWDQQLFGLQRHFLYWFSSDQCSFLFVDNQIHGMNKGGTCKLNDDISVTAVHAVWFLFFFFSIFRITPAALMTLQWAEVRLWDTSSAPLKVFNQHSFDGVGTSIYHTGDTAIFGDMSLISAIYKPSVCLMCIGDNYTMGPIEAAYTLNHVFHHQSLWCD